MPVIAVKRGEKIIGYRWGSTGKLYTVKQYGASLARFKALAQGRAIMMSKGMKSKKAVN